MVKSRQGNEGGYDGFLEPTEWDKLNSSRVGSEQREGYGKNSFEKKFLEHSRTLYLLERHCPNQYEEYHIYFSAFLSQLDYEMHLARSPVDVDLSFIREEVLHWGKVAEIEEDVEFSNLMACLYEECLDFAEKVVRKL